MPSQILVYLPLTFKSVLELCSILIVEVYLLSLSEEGTGLEVLVVRLIGEHIDLAWSLIGGNWDVQLTLI